jgi:hypothetical protein
MDDATLKNAGVSFAGVCFFCAVDQNIVLYVHITNRLKKIVRETFKFFKILIEVLIRDLGGNFMLNLNSAGFYNLIS